MIINKNEQQKSAQLLDAGELEFEISRNVTLLNLLLNIMEAEKDYFAKDANANVELAFVEQGNKYNNEMAQQILTNLRAIGKGISNGYQTE